MKGLQTKLTVIILVIFLVALGALGGLNYWKARQIISEKITKDMAEQAVNSAGDVGDWLEARKAEMMVMAVTPVVLEGNSVAIVPFLANVVKQNSAYNSIGYADLSGASYVSTGTPSNVKEREFFQRAVKGEISISDPLVARSTGQLVVTIGIPVKVEGKVTGVLYGGISMEGLAQKVLAVKIGQTGYASITQGDGLKIIHPNKEVAMKDNPLKDPNAAAAQKQLTERMVKGEKGIDLSSVGREDRYTAYAPVPGSNWSLALTVPVSEVAGAVDALTTISAVTIVIVLVIAAIAVAFMTRRIVGPLQTMVAYIQEVAAGDLSARQRTITSRDEIGQLAEAIVSMRDHLRSLVNQVRGATEQVSAASEELTASAEQSAQAANQVAIVIGEVAAGAEKQLKAVDETASIVGQMSASIQQIAANANTVAGTSAQSANEAQEGSKAVKKAITQMGTDRK